MPELRFGGVHIPKCFSQRRITNRNPTAYDEEAFRRTVNFPTRGIGNTTLNKIADAARLHNVSLWEVISNPLGFNLDVNAGTAKKLAGFKELIESFISQLQELSAYELATRIVKESGIASDAYQDQTPEGMSRQENLQELLGGIHEYCESRQEEGLGGIGLMDFLSRYLFSVIKIPTRKLIKRKLP